jgi:uncharacterized protein HemX
MKRGVIVTSTILVLVALGVGVYFGWKEYSGKKEIEKQLSDTQQKIQELPELENDIFTKCIESQKKIATNIKNCQEKTQKSIHTLSQELSGVKSDLENQLSGSTVYNILKKL